MFVSHLSPRHLQTLTDIIKKENEMKLEFGKKYRKPEWGKGVWWAPVIRGKRSPDCWTGLFSDGTESFKRESSDWELYEEPAPTVTKWLWATPEGYLATAGAFPQFFSEKEIRDSGWTKLEWSATEFPEE